MTDNIYSSLLKKQKTGKKQLAVLIDPDKFHSNNIINIADEAAVDYFFVGGSLLTNGSLSHCIEAIKKISSIPVVLFPGGTSQVCKNADAILLLSLISGRNADMLIGNHVLAAPVLRSSQLEILPTGYILIESGKQTTVSYISNTIPIPYEKDDIAMCTAMAGEMLGLKLLYLEAGSGALNPVSGSMIKKVRDHTSIPLIVGGGIRTPEQVRAAFGGGADLVVIGNAFEKEPAAIKKIASTVHAY